MSSKRPAFPFIEYIFVCLFALIPPTLYGQSGIDINKYIENPEVFTENEEPPASLLVPYSNTEKAVTAEYKKSNYYLSLNGRWKFDWHINPGEVKKDFYKTSFSDKDWKEITVPSVWQMQGYDHNMYRNVPMEFTPYDPPKVPDEINPTGCYRREFEVPKDWKERKIYIHFFGVQSALFLWINGEYVGYHEDGMTSAEYDITRYIKPGKNTAAAMVLRWCDGSYLEDQDMFRFSGIYRDVFLYSKPLVMMKDIFIKTDLDKKYQNAKLIMDCKFVNFSGAGDQNSFRYTLYNKDGSVFTKNTTEVFNINDKLEKSFSTEVISPVKWSDEKPYLYTLLMELLDEKGNVIEITSKKIGFRELEVKDGITHLNGMPVYFRGTNRHEHSPENGRAVTEEIMLSDIRLLKQFNFNAVRTSHYPNDPRWYDLCDEYGILLQDEINAECHYTEWDFPSRKNYFNAFMDRFIRMVERDKNHPSVVMWSTGNECGLDKPHYAMADYIKKYDPTRFLMHQSNWPDGEAPYADIKGPRYPIPSGLYQMALKSSKPIVMGEYAHAMGNSLGHFDEFWDIIYSTPKLHGGFVWDWVDQGLKVKARYTPDSSPNNVQCAVMGNPELIKVNAGSAIKLSGLDDWIEVYDDPRLDIRGKALVIEVSLVPQKFYTENPIVTKAFQFGITQKSADSVSFYINSYKNVITAAVPVEWTGKQHEIKAQYDGKSMQLFIDGKLSAEKNYSENINTSHYPVNVGRDAYRNTDQLLGWISNHIYNDVKIFDNIQAGSTPLLSLQFDKITDGSDYFTYGISPFCHNGMVTPDRKPQPELWQAKRSQAPIRFYSEDPASGKFKVRNKYAFTNLNEFTTEWYVYQNGKLMQKGIIDLNVEPQREKEFSIPFGISSIGSYVVEFSCKLKNAEPFRDKGFEVYFQQFEVKGHDIPLTANSSGTGKIRVSENESSYTLLSGTQKYEISKSSGDLNVYSGGKKVLSSVNANVWRAPISNEKVDWGRAEAEAWYSMGMNEYYNRAAEFELTYSDDSSSADLRFTTYTLFPRSHDMIINKYKYTISGNGEAVINHQMEPSGRFDVEWLPCLGLSLKTPSDFQYINWYGYGPYENYIDRFTGSRLGIHNAAIDSVQNPYQEPQEYGNYSGVKWFVIKNNAREGFRFSFSKDVNFSAVPYYNLDRARYTFQLLKDDHSRVNISYGITGLGDTPNPPMPVYRVYPEKYSNTITITPVKEAALSKE